MGCEELLERGRKLHAEIDAYYRDLVAADISQGAETNIWLAGDCFKAVERKLEKYAAEENRT